MAVPPNSVNAAVKKGPAATALIVFAFKIFTVLVPGANSLMAGKIRYDRLLIQQRRDLPMNPVCQNLVAGMTWMHTVGKQRHFDAAVRIAEGISQITKRQPGELAEPDL